MSAHRFERDDQRGKGVNGPMNLAIRILLIEYATARGDIRNKSFNIAPPPGVTSGRCSIPLGHSTRNFETCRGPQLPPPGPRLRSR